MILWYRVIILRQWFVYLRLRTVINDAALSRVRETMLNMMWVDLAKTTGALKTEDKLKRIHSWTTKAELRWLHGLLILTFIDMDDGLMHDDCRLASAI